MSVRTNCRCVCRSVSVRIGCLCLSSCFYITLIFLYVYFNCDLNVVLCVLYRERTVVLCVWDRLVSVRSCVLQLTSLCGRPPSALVWALPVVHCLDLGSFWRAWISGLAAFQTVTWQRTPDTVCTTRRDHWSSYLFFLFFFLSSPKLLEPFRRWEWPLTDTPILTIRHSFTLEEGCRNRCSEFSSPPPPPPPPPSSQWLSYNFKALSKYVPIFVVNAADSAL